MKLWLKHGILNVSTNSIYKIMPLLDGGGENMPVDNYMDVITPYLESVLGEEYHYMEFYRELFPEGELEGTPRKVYNSEGYYEYEYDDEHDENGRRQYRYNGIAIEVTDKKKKVKGKRWDIRKKMWVDDEVAKPVVRRYTINDSLDGIGKMVSGKYFCLMSPLSYIGKERTAANARNCYAIVIDLDKIRQENGFPVGVANYLHQMEHEPSYKIGSQPKPSAIVSSGTGLHLYFFLEKPIPLTEQNVVELQKLKRALTTKVWHDSITSVVSEAEIQQEGIFQGFRVVGTVTKVGTRARAWKCGDRVNVDHLNQYVRPADRATIVWPEDISPEERKEAAKLNKERLAELKENYPEWYERRIVRGMPPGQFLFSRAVYDKHLERIEEEGRVGHRYWCIAMLAVFAVKCGISYDELETDAFSLRDRFESLTVEESNHFTNDDVIAALEYYQNPFYRISRRYIVERTGIEYEPQKRNGQKQKQHLWGDEWIIDGEPSINVCRGNREIRYRKAVRDKDKINKYIEDHPEATEEEIKKAVGAKGPVGRPPEKKALIEAYIKEHPTATPTEIARELKISRTTVYKWIKEYEKQEKLEQ